MGYRIRQKKAARKIRMVHKQWTSMDNHQKRKYFQSKRLRHLGLNESSGDRYMSRGSRSRDEGKS